MNNKHYYLPNPIVNYKEIRELTDLTEEYKSLIKPRSINKTVNSINSLIPKPIKDITKNKLDSVTVSTKEKLSENDIFTKAINILSKAFDKIEELAEKVTLKEKDILKQITGIRTENSITDLNEICLIRSYDISKLVDKNKRIEIIAAIIEGAATGAPGFAGIPFNLALSSFLYYVTVQSIALFYGYDTKNNPAELEIASEIFMQAVNPQSIDKRALSPSIYDFMLFNENTLRRNENYDALLSNSEAQILLKNINFIAETSAKIHFEKSDKSDFPKKMFSYVFEQVGRKVAQKSILKTVPLVGAVVGGILDHRQMVNTIKFAEIFYQKRFVYEKGSRINDLQK